MTEKDVISKIKLALSDLYKRDLLLIENATNEKTISAQLMCYLKKRFKSWDVDVEYNRDGDSTKEDSLGKNRFPDIIIHQRTPDRKRGYSPENNLAAIEVKGYWNHAPRTDDEQKLVNMKAHYGYKYLLRVELNLKEAKVFPIT